MTQLTAAGKSRDIEATASPSRSPTREDPYRQADLRGQVVERIDGDAALVLADRIARKYTGEPFPLRGEATVIYALEVVEARHHQLAFTDDG